MTFNSQNSNGNGKKDSYRSPKDSNRPQKPSFLNNETDEQVFRSAGPSVMHYPNSMNAPFMGGPSLGGGFSNNAVFSPFGGNNSSFSPQMQKSSPMGKFNGGLLLGGRGKGPVMQSRGKGPMIHPKLQSQTNNLGSRLDDNRAPVWTGPLSPYNTFTSNLMPSQLVNATSDVLKAMVGDGLVDYDFTQFQGNGRMYANGDIAEFQVTIYKESNEYELNKSILEIRRTNGDSFVHEELFRGVSNDLLKSKSINGQEKDDDFDSGGFGLVGLGKFPKLGELDFGDDFESDTDFEMDGNSVTTDENVEEYAQELLDVCKDRNAYRDSWRHSATQLVEQMKITGVFEYVSKQKNVIGSIMAPICDDLYDCLIIKSTLEVVEQLLSKGIKSSNMKETKEQIEKLRRDWREGPCRQLGTQLKMHFVKSQQIVAQCSKCLKYLN